MKNLDNGIVKWNKTKIIKNEFRFVSFAMEGQIKKLKYPSFF